MEGHVFSRIIISVSYHYKDNNKYIYLKINDVKNNFTFLMSMTPPGKLNEVEWKITKKTTKLTIAKIWNLLL